MGARRSALELLWVVFSRHIAASARLLAADLDFVSNLVPTVEMIVDPDFFSDLDGAPVGRRGPDKKHCVVRCLVDRIAKARLDRKALACSIHGNDRTTATTAPSLCIESGAALAAAAKPIMTAVAQSVLSMKTSHSSFSSSFRYRRSAACLAAATEATTLKHEYSFSVPMTI
jgi:hypothetical protein